MIFQIQATIILLLIYAGVCVRKNRKVHVPMMYTAIIWDILLVLQIEFNRGAIAKASKVMSNPYLLTIHVLMALTTIVLYIVMVVLGRKILKGKASSSHSRWHRNFGILTIFLRTMVYITSYFVIP